jgi:hypothetical protein
MADIFDQVLSERQNVSQEDIFDQVITERSQPSQGDIFDQVLLERQQKGGVTSNEQNKQNQPEANTDSNEQRQANEQVQPSVEQGTQPSEMPRAEDQQFGGRYDQTNLSVDTEAQIGGENIAKETQQAQEGSQGQEAGQGLRGQDATRNQAQVSDQEGTSVPSAVSKVIGGITSPFGYIGEGTWNAIAGIQRTLGFDKAAEDSAFIASQAVEDFATTFGGTPVEKGGAGEKAAKIAGALIELPALVGGSLIEGAVGGALATAGFGALIAKGYGESKEGLFNKYLEEGLDENEANKKSTTHAAISTMAVLPAYYFAGNIAGKAADAFIAESATKLVETVSRIGLNAVANGVASAASRGFTAGLEGENVLDAVKDISLEGSIQDVFFAAHSQAVHVKEMEKQGKIKDVLSELSDPLLEEYGKVNPRMQQLVDAERSKRDAERLVKEAEAVDLPETAGIVEEAVQKPLKFSSEAKLTDFATEKLNELKAKTAEELTTEEASELEFLRSVPSTGELLSEYGASIRKPAGEKEKSISLFEPEEQITQRVSEAQAKLDELNTRPVETKQIQNLKKTQQRIIDKGSELLETQQTREAELVRREEAKKPAEEKVTTTEAVKPTEAAKTPKVEVVTPKSLEEATTPEEVDAYVKANKERLQSAFRTNTDNPRLNSLNRERIGKDSKALGMQAAARKRQITGELTAKEQAAKTKKEESNYVGKKVAVDGKNGEVIGNPFGRVKVRFEDGTESTHLPEKVTAAEKGEAAKTRETIPSVEQPLTTVTEKPAGAAKPDVVTTESVAPKEVNSFAEATTPEEVDAFLKKTIKEDAAFINNTKEKNAFINQVRKGAFARNKELKAEAKKEKITIKSLDNGQPRAVPKKEKPLPKTPKGKRVLAAAYKRLSDGKIFYGANHKEALLESGMSWKDIQSKYGNPSQRESPEFGYKTDSNPFVSRREAEQVGTASKQVDVAGLAEDKQLGLDIHSNRIALDEFPAFKAPEFSMGAARPSEFADKKAFEATLVKGTQAHESIKGEVTFEKWKPAFLSGLKKGGQFTESKLKSIFQESEGLNAYAKSFDRKPEEIIDFPELWSGKSAIEIENLAKKKRPRDIKLDNDDIDQLRQTLGYDPIMKKEAEKWGDTWKEAMLQINSNTSAIPALIEQIQTNPRALNPVDTVILRYATLDALHTLDIETMNVASATNKIDQRKYTQRHEQAKMDLNQLLEISSRTQSASGSSLNAVKLINKANGNVISMMNQYKAAKRYFQKTEGMTKKELENNLSEKEMTRIREQSKALSDAIESRDGAVREAKILEANKSISDFLESAKKDRKSGEAITDLSVDEQITQYTMEIESSGGDTMNAGVAMRGLARAISEKLNTTDVATVSKEVNARIKDMMGKEWNEDTTKDALAGNGIFGQHTERGAKGSLRTLERRTSDFEKEIAGAMKAKTQRERDLKMTKLLERNRVDVKHLEPQIADQITPMMTIISKLIGELKNNELRPCE